MDGPAFLVQARRYVARRGIVGALAEDLVQTMALDRLQTPHRTPSLRISYLHACDTVGGRQARLPAPPAAVTQRHDPRPLAALLALLPPQGLDRALFLLWSLYGFSQTELAWLCGMSKGGVDTLLRRVRMAAKERAQG